MKKILGLSWGIICAHLAAIFLSFVLMMFFGNLTEKIGITGILSVLIWFGAIYSVGWNKGRKDARKIAGVHPDLKSNALAALLCSGITLVLLIIRVLAFYIAAGGVVSSDKPGVLIAADIIYRLWNFPFVNYMQSGSLLSYSIPVIFPFVVYTASYMLGLKRFSIMENIMPDIIYKKKHD